MTLPQFASPEPATEICNPLAQSWYPLVCGADIVRGKSMIVDLFGHDVVVFRDRNNQVGVVTRQCIHMGGDLSRGTVTDQGIRCPIHGWEFATGGERINGGPKSRPACQPALPCVEQFGIVFAFLGPKPLFELPLPGLPVYCSRVRARVFDARYDVPSIFGFDSEHFATVHKRAIDSMDIYSRSPYHLATRISARVDGTNLNDKVLRAAGLDSVDSEIDFWAANIIFGHHQRTGTFAFLASLPLSEHRSRMFVVLMKTRPPGGRLRQSLGALRFRLMQPMMDAFVAQDEKALSGVRFDPDSPYVADNAGLQRWLGHYRRLPKIDVDTLFDDRP